ncbi:hypothetical protein DW886_03645 [Enterocloster aldenensis]|uniref:hypothetical protein n=1 Tax=Enterocloster aldenensis TaxID=358742 RepID=UPI000E4725A7|nr:hypothetical protein DW886_03645 [Enterocloster aldenensis]
MEYFLCMMDTSFSESESNTVDRIISRLAEQNCFQYKSEPIKLRSQHGSEHLRKYKITWSHEDKHLEEKEGETGYISKTDEAILMAACQNQSERELLKRCIFGYRYSSPGRSEMLTFKKPAEVYRKEKEAKRRRFQKIREQEYIMKLKEERRKQIDTIAA